MAKNSSARRPKTEPRLEDKYRINDEIWVRDNVRLIGEGYDGTVVHIAEARKMASEQGLDIVEINGRASPPVMRICDFSKFIYEQKKTLKKNRQKSKPLKEIQLRVNIAQHDLETKLSQARKFIEEGSKVKVVLSMKGRELSRKDESKRAIYEFLASAQEFASAESIPKDEGNKTIAIIKAK